MKAELQVRKTIEEHNLIERGDGIVIGLSGGPDSMCLYDVLMAMKEELELEIYPVHVNHKFRPGAAEEDQSFVEELCERRGTPCRSFVVDCNDLARKESMTGEEAGRKARYDAFWQVAGEIDSRSVKIAVAQNADDQAETILFRLLRGTGTEGLAGIAYSRQEVRGESAVSVIRPLLDTWRKDIEEYCQEKDLMPVRDHTNEEAIYTRNKIRLELIPYLEEKHNSNIKEALVRLGKIAGADREYFRQETDKAYREALITKDTAGRDFGHDMVVMDRERLAGFHKAIRRRVMVRALGKIGLMRDISAERLQAAEAIISKKQSAKTVEFPRGYCIKVARGRVYFFKR